jgi:hypothetical protein
MHEDSPPPFIVIRTPVRRSAYDRALELVGIVQKVLDHATTRFHLKDRLDRAATALVFEIAAAHQLAPSQRWRHYRKAQSFALNTATIIDILTHQHAAPAEDLEAARKLVHDLLAELTGLG